MIDKTEISEEQINEFQQAVREFSDYDFGDYSISSLKRRLSKISEEYGADINRLIRTISADPLAMEEVVKKVTVNTTEMFRDTEIWKQLLVDLLPRFAEKDSIHIWHAGCSTGQEVYSMMILLDQLRLLDKAHLYASDLNTDVLDLARIGTYRLRFNREYIENYFTVFSEENQKACKEPFFPIEKYFTVDEAMDQIRMREFLKNRPIYQKIDLVKDDNLFFINFDIIVCRNVIIYFNYDLQNKVLKLFHRSMRDNGYLMLGMHESIIGSGTELFIKDDPFYLKKTKRKRDN